jgi:hypothetical protein
MVLSGAMRRLCNIAAAVMACVVAGLPLIDADAAVVTAGMHTLAPNAANQTIAISVSGGELVAGVDLFLQIGDGGVLVGGDDTGPTITAIDFGDVGIFAGNNTGVFLDPSPLLWGATTTTQTGTVAATGQLALVTVNTVGITSGRYDLILNPPTTGPTALAVVTTSLVNGWIQIAAARPGDFNGDGAVDAADLALWRENYGLTDAAKPPQGDADGDQVVDGDDFLIWQQSLGPAGGGVRAVPEPSSLTSALLLGASLVLHGRRRTGLALQDAIHGVA